MDRALFPRVPDAYDGWALQQRQRVNRANPVSGRILGAGLADGTEDADAPQDQGVDADVLMRHTDLYCTPDHAAEEHDETKPASDNLTRENVMKQAASLDMTLPMLLPGVNVKTGPDDFYPIEREQLMKFDGKGWALFGKVYGR